jgi:type IV secretion system protein TrbL
MRTPAFMAAVPAKARGLALGALARIAASGEGRGPGRGRTIVLVLLLMFMLASLGSFAQPAPAPAAPTAATAMTNVADAIENGLNGLTAGGRDGVLEIGRTLFGFFVVLNLVWMLLKGFVSGGGFFNGFFADFVPFAVTAAVVALFLDRDAAAVLNASMNVLGSAVLGEGVSSISSMIAAAGQQAFTAVTNVWSVAPATQVSWEPATWFAAIPVVLYALAGTAATVFFILFALAIYIANLVMSQVAIVIAMAFAPFFVPFMLFRPASWLFDSWLRFFLTAAMMKIIGLLMLKITSSMMASLVSLSQQAAAAKPTVLDAVGIDIVLFSSMILLAGISALLMAQVPALATGLLSGSGGAGFGSWANIASRSQATRGILGGMGASSGGSGRLNQPANAGSALARTLPNVLKPAANVVGSGLARYGGRTLAKQDAQLARSAGAAYGEFNIGRDLSSMSRLSGESYVRRLESMNLRTAKKESRESFVGPPSPRYTISKPVSSTTPRKPSTRNA